MKVLGLRVPFSGPDGGARKSKPRRPDGPRTIVPADAARDPFDAARDRLRAEIPPPDDGDDLEQE